MRFLSARWRVALLLLVTLVAGLIWLWFTYGYVGTRWRTFTGVVGGRTYVVGFDSIVSWRSFRIAMPGGGSDNIHGYIRLHDEHGHKLKEVFADGLAFIEPHFFKHSIVLLGIDVIWDLPPAPAGAPAGDP